MDTHGSTATISGALAAVSSRIWLIGLCAIAPAADSLLKGLALGTAVLASLTATAVMVRLIRGWLPRTARLAACALVIAGVVTAVEMLFKVLAFEFHLALGIFLPLIATNSVILARADRLATRGGELLLRPGWLQEWFVILLILALTGGLRELLGHGRVLGGMADFFGEAMGAFTLNFNDTGSGFALALQPAGAFFILAALIAVFQARSSRGENT